MITESGIITTAVPFLINFLCPGAHTLHVQTIKPMAAQRHWAWVTHICVGNLTIGSDYGLSPGRRQAIIWINAGILLIGPFGTNVSEILIAIHAFSFKKMHLKTSSGKWLPSCLGLNVLNESCELVD